MSRCRGDNWQEFAMQVSVVENVGDCTRLAHKTDEIIVRVMNDEIVSCRTVVQTVWIFATFVIVNR